MKYGGLANCGPSPVLATCHIQLVLPATYVHFFTNNPEVLVSYQWMKQVASTGVRGHEVYKPSLCPKAREHFSGKRHAGNSPVSFGKGAMEKDGICTTSPAPYVIPQVAGRWYHRLLPGLGSNNAPRLTDYRNGERISTAFAESTVDQMISRWMVNKQQMQWAPRGAHLLLQARTHELNGELRDTFCGWYPGMSEAHTHALAT